MRLFNKKEKQVQLVELTKEQKDKYIMDILDLFLDNPRTWDEDLTKTQISILNDSQYVNIKAYIDEFSDMYKKINKIKQSCESNNIDNSYGSAIIDFFSSSDDSLNII